MKKKITKIPKQKFLITLILFAFLFSIFKVGKSLAAEDSFVIKNAEVIEQSEGTEVNNVSFEKTKITNDITFRNVGDSVTYKVVVKNNENINFIIKSVSDDNTNEYVTYTYDNYEGTKINADEEATFNVTATYVKELTDITKKDQSFSVNISFELEDEKGYIKSPKTGDNITIYMVTTILSLTVLLIMMRKNMLIKIHKNKEKKCSNPSAKHMDKGIKFFSIFLAVIVILPTISKAVSNSLVLTFENTYRLYNTPSDISIEVSDEDIWKVSKKVTINYNTSYTSNEYIKEYSLDNGETWNTYTEPITIEENNKLVKARVKLKETGEVLDTNSKKVIKVDPTVPTIAISLGDRYYSGQELDLASVTTTTYGESGATVKWTIGDMELTNMSETNKIDRTDSQYEIQVVGTITTGAGLTATTTSQTIIIQYALWDDFLIDGIITRDNIQSMKFGSWAEKPTNPTGSKDISYNDTDVVFEYYTLDQETNLYDIYITSPYGYTRYYNDDMGYLFQRTPNVVSFDFEYLDMFNITNTAYLFNDITNNEDYEATFVSDSKLTSIRWGNKFNTINVTDMSFMFAGLDKLTEIDLNSFDMQNVTSILDMFSLCKSLERIECSDWNLSSCLNIGECFNKTLALTEVDVSKWNVSNVKNMRGVFYDSGIQSIDVSKWNTSNVTDMQTMFANCKIQEIDLSSFNTSNVTYTKYMFYGCNQLRTIDFKNLNLSNVIDARQMFRGTSSLQNVYVKAMPTYKSGANTSNMWYGSRISNYTIKEYDD